MSSCLGGDESVRIRAARRCCPFARSHPASPQIDEAEAAVEPAPVEYNDAGEDSRKTEPAGRYACLTGRERQIAQLIETNASDRDIAEELALSVRTVHAHVRSIFTKLGISRRAQLRATHSIDSTTAV